MKNLWFCLENRTPLILLILASQKGIMISDTRAQDTKDILVVALAKSQGDLPHLKILIGKVNAFSGSIKIVIIDVGGTLYKSLLTFLLTAFEAQRPRSVLLDVSLAASTSQPPTRASLGPPRLPRIGDSRTCRSSGPTTRSLCSCTLPGSPSSTAPASSCRRPARNTSTSRRSAPTCPKTRPRGLPRLRRGPPQPSCAREHGQGLAAGPRQGLARSRPRSAPPLAHQ